MNTILDVHFRILLLVCMLLSGLGSIPDTNAAQPQPPSTPITVDPNMLGLVIRDPWYDFGTHPDFPDQPNRVAQERMGATLAEMGVRWVRLEFHISDASAVADNIARYDYFIREVAPRYNLQILGLLGFGLMRDYPPHNPSDSRSLSYPNTYTDPIYGGGVNEYSRKWLDRACLVSNRYKDQIAAYEVLNEQNRLPPNGDGVPATVTARLHTKFYRIFRQNSCFDPADDQSWRDTIPIILGGLHPKGTGEPGAKNYVSDRKYLQQIYASDGFVSYQQTYGHYPIDGLGYHPYPEEIRLSLQSDMDLIGGRLDAMRLLLNSLDPRQPPFWITEVGYNAGYLKQTHAGQAQFMQAVYNTLSLRNDVHTIFWFKYEDFAPASGPYAQKWGVVHIPFTENTGCPGSICYAVDGAPQVHYPSYYVYRELAGLPVSRLYLPIISH